MASSTPTTGHEFVHCDPFPDPETASMSEIDAISVAQDPREVHLNWYGKFSLTGKTGSLPVCNIFNRIIYMKIPAFCAIDNQSVAAAFRIREKGCWPRSFTKRVATAAEQALLEQEIATMDTVEQELKVDISPLLPPLMAAKLKEEKPPGNWVTLLIPALRVIMNKLCRQCIL